MEKRIYTKEDLYKAITELDIDRMMEFTDEFLEKVFKKYGQEDIYSGLGNYGNNMIPMDQPSVPPANAGENMMLYTKKDAVRFVNYCINRIDEFDLTDKDIEKHFYDYGHPYKQPAAPVPMCDEDKVWHAAVQIYNTGDWDISDSVHHSFNLLDEVRRQQKEREENEIRNITLSKYGRGGDSKSEDKEGGK